MSTLLEILSPSFLLRDAVIASVLVPNGGELYRRARDYGLQAKLVAAGSTVAHASAQAHGMIYNTVQRQAAMLAFVDNFKMLGVVFFAIIPVLLLMKKPRAAAGAMPSATIEPNSRAFNPCGVNREMLRR